MTNLATDLDGQGGNLNKLIASAAGTVQLLAEKGDDLGQLNGTLGQLTGTLDTDTSNIEQLVEQYDTVSTTIAQHSGQLNDAITQLAGASTGLVDLLVPNLQPLEADVGTVTTAGRTLDRNLAAVDEVLQNGNNLFQGAERAYDPTYNWLDLNIQAAPGVSGAYMAGLIRDRLAGVCRRIVANHSTGLSAADDSHPQRVRQPRLGLLRPVAQRHPEHPRLADRPGQRHHHAVVAHAAGARQDRQRRAGQRRLGVVDAGTPVQGAGRRPDDHHDDDGAAHHHDHDQSLRPAQRRFGLHRRLVGPQQLERRRRRHLGVERRTAVRRRDGKGSDRLARRDARHHATASTADLTLTAPDANELPPLPASMTAYAARARPPRPHPSVVARPHGVAVMRRRRLFLTAPALVALAAGLTGCSTSGGQRTASAVFSDVGDLSNGAQVQLADVPVGSVSSISLDGNKAKVVLSFDQGVRIPANVNAAIDRTTILGDQFVELTVPKDETGRAAATAPQLPDGAVIRHTSIVPDVEQFVEAGSEVFGAISSTELAQIIEAGGEGFTGQAASLKAFLSDLDTVATAYAQHTDDITAAVNGLNSLERAARPGHQPG